MIDFENIDEIKRKDPWALGKNDKK